MGAEFACDLRHNLWGICRQSIRPPTEVIIDMGKTSVFWTRTSMKPGLLRCMSEPEALTSDWLNWEKSSWICTNTAGARWFHHPDRYSPRSVSRTAVTTKTARTRYWGLFPSTEEVLTQNQLSIFRPRNENVPAYRSTPPTGQATVMTRSRPAHHLFTNDDYVLSTAFQVCEVRLLSVDVLLLDAVW